MDKASRWPLVFPIRRLRRRAHSYSVGLAGSDGSPARSHNLNKSHPQRCRRQMAARTPKRLVRAETRLCSQDVSASRRRSAEDLLTAATDVDTSCRSYGCRVAYPLQKARQWRDYTRRSSKPPGTLDQHANGPAQALLAVDARDRHARRRRIPADHVGMTLLRGARGAGTGWMKLPHSAAPASRSCILDLRSYNTTLSRAPRRLAPGWCQGLEI